MHSNNPYQQNHPRKAKKVLFLCVGNSARSQMAHGLAQEIFQSQVEVSSAGSQPKSVNPLSIEALRKIGIDISSHSSRHLSDFELESFDLIVTLCADEVCPVVSAAVSKEHWPFEDPAKHNRLEDFERIRDEIKEKLISFGNSEGWSLKDF